jgi:hypothetical protein
MSGDHYIWKGRSRKDRCGFLFEVIAAVGALVTAGSIGISFNAFRLQQEQLKDEQQWRREQLATEFLRQWDRETSANRKEVERLVVKYQERNPAALTDTPAIGLALAAEAWAALGYTEENSRGHDMWKLRDNIISMLNFFESMAVAVDRGSVDSAIIKDSMSGTMARWREKLRAFTDRADQSRKTRVWSPYYDLVDRWQPKKEPPAPRERGTNLLRHR